VLFTPALSCGVLDGVVRAKVLARAEEMGFAVHEAAARLDDLRDIDGLAITNSLIGVCPVNLLDGKPVPISPEFAILKV
jgi:branched-chain amino acid aminotransferase/4-amino-4-deoxychorismate lyase